MPNTSWNHLILLELLFLITLEYVNKYKIINKTAPPGGNDLMKRPKHLITSVFLVHEEKKSWCYGMYIA